MPNCAICGMAFKLQGIKTHKKACKKKRDETLLNQQYLENLGAQSAPAIKCRTASNN